mgnify:CR=1 FL=1
MMTKKIAIPVSNGILDPHFGHCQQFVLFEVNNQEIGKALTIDAPPHEPGLLPRFLANHGASDIIAGGMGQRAIQLFQQAGINVFVGAPQLPARQLVEGFLNQSIRFSANYCDH